MSDLSVYGIIKSTEIFCDLSLEEIKTITTLDGFSVGEFSNGETVIAKNESNSRLAIVISGRLEGINDDVRMKAFSVTDIFGVATLFGKNSRSMTTIIAKKKSVVAFIDFDLMQKIITENPLTALRYIEFLSKRIVFLNKKIDSFTSATSVCRLSKYLISLYTDNSDFIIVPLSLCRLAKTLDIGRASLYRAFDTLEEQKIILRKNKNIQILDKNKLLLKTKGNN